MPDTPPVITLRDPRSANVPFLPRSHESHDRNCIRGRLADGIAVCLVPDAGYPGISDAGSRIAVAAIHAGHNVELVMEAGPGTPELLFSGLPSSSYIFKGVTLSQTDPQRCFLNVLATKNGQVQIESALLTASAQVFITLARIYLDLILFTMPRFRWFDLPKPLRPNSRVMPQKRNPNRLELARASVVAPTHRICQIPFHFWKSLSNSYNHVSKCLPFNQLVTDWRLMECP